MFEQARSLLDVLDQVPLKEGRWSLQPNEYAEAYDAYWSRMSR